MIEELQKSHPEYGIVTEESGVINKSNNKNKWIIDPIDGTMNFLNGIPQFAISVAYEENNEILVFWTNGIKKISFLNVVVKYSLFFLILQLFLSLVIVPAAQDKARSFIRQSNIDYLPLLIKPKKFIDTVERLTIYSDKKEKLYRMSRWKI